MTLMDEGMELALGWHAANNMVAAIRSPGSTLKPFIYAAAMDKNIIHSLN